MTPYTPEELSEVIAEVRAAMQDSDAANASDLLDFEDEVFYEVAHAALPRLLATLEAQAAEIERWKGAVEEVSIARDPVGERDEEERVYTWGWQDACSEIRARVNNPKEKA